MDGNNSISARYVGFKVLCKKHIVACIIGTLFSVPFTPVLTSAKEIIGQAEEVILLPWNIKLLARIDTGAARTSIDAREIQVTGKIVKFKLTTHGRPQTIELPIVGWAAVRTSEGKENRPVIRLQLCIGRQLVSADVSLNDRSKMHFSLLVGRDVLAGRFLVDVSRRQLLRPNCGKLRAR